VTPPVACPAGSERNAGKAIPAGQTAATYCNEADIAPNEGEKPRPKPVVKPAGAVAGTSAGVAGTSAGIAGTDASVPSAVNAGLSDTAGASTLQLVGQLLTGAGLLLFVGACWTGAGRRRRVVGAI
jgi:hypothetical protein